MAIAAKLTAKNFLLLQFVEKLAPAWAGHSEEVAAATGEEFRIASIFRTRFLAALGMTSVENVFQQTPTVKFKLPPKSNVLPEVLSSRRHWRVGAKSWD